MRALLPDPSDDVDLEAAYAPSPSPHSGRPFVRVNMIASLDGSVAVDGRSGALGGPADRRLFDLLRSLADVIVVGAGTMRAENYGPARISADAQARRSERGQGLVPAIAVVTRSAELDWDSPFFASAVARPIIITTGLAAPRCPDVADVIVCGDTEVDLGVALDELGTLGAGNVLVEGGPSLNGKLAEAGLIDELCLTISPRIVGGDGPRLVAGPELAGALEWRTAHLLEEDGFYFMRLCPTRA